MAARLALRFLIAAAITLSGCAHKERRCVPAEMTKLGPTVDLNAPPGEDHAVDQKILDQLFRRMQAEPKDEQPGAKRYQILALSGGAVYGAYSVGVLNGWTRAGDRPCFDIVTGISTGGLIATLAFLGPAYDRQLCELYTTITSDDVFRRRAIISLLWSDSAASSAPLKKMIDEQIDCRVLQQVAQAYTQGRRLYIGTTDLDAKRLVVWDMGIIAGSGRPDALELYRKIVLASASVPGFFPPVSIDVTVNGQRFTELHVDGGTTNQVFIPGAALKIDQAALDAGRKPLAGSEVYAIIAGKLYGDAACTEPKIKGIASSALSSLTFAQTRADLIRIWTLCQLGGLGFHVTAIPQEYPAPTDSLDFNPEAMRRMFDVGVQQGMNHRAWRTTPPGTGTSEQYVPRAGTEFLAPIVELPGRPCGK